MSTRLLICAVVVAAVVVTPRAQPSVRASADSDAAADLASLVNPFIGSANGGNTFPGAVAPFGMLQWSPETTRGDHTRVPAPGGYQYDARRIRGFALTHLSGTGCRGASGDVPLMPIAGVVKESPSADTTDEHYASGFAHANEHASPGFYQVRLDSEIKVDVAAADRSGVARLTYPAGGPASLLVRVSDSEVGSSDAHVTIDRAAHRISGRVSSGNFCGYIDAVDQRSYYTLYFVALFDRPFSDVGVWRDDRVIPGATEASGGTTYGRDGYPVAGKGSGAYVAFDTTAASAVTVRVGISYVSVENAAANLRAEIPEGTTVEAVQRRTRDAWNRALGRVRISGGSADEQTIFYTALYHVLLHPNLFSDIDGRYEGFDRRVHAVSSRQHAQYANFSGWDVYRCQLQLVALLEPNVASDIAQSLLNQADQNGGAWDRWTHNSGATHVMEGDPSPTAIAAIVAFGGTAFDVERAYLSLARAATVATPADASDEGCPDECVGQRPSLDRWLSLHYLPAGANAWGAAGETLEDAAADFSLAQLARMAGHGGDSDAFLRRSGYWRNLFNPAARPGRGYVQERNADGTWPPFDPASEDGFAEGSSAQYTWMVPFDAHGLFELMGGTTRAVERLDAFFHTPDGAWALTGVGGLHAELANEPSIGAPWLYDFAGRPDKTAQTVRQALVSLWSNAPYGIPGNDDLGAMSAWYVWGAIGVYPEIPGRAELLVGSPLFPQVRIARANGIAIAIDAPAASVGTPFVSALRVNGTPSSRPWLPDSFVARGGTLAFDLTATASVSWGRDAADAPPSFPPR